MAMMFFSFVGLIWIVFRARRPSEQSWLTRASATPSRRCSAPACLGARVRDAVVPSTQGMHRARVLRAAWRWRMPAAS